MDTHFLDTSFTLYHVVDTSTAYRNLYSADYETLSTWSRSLKDYLESHTPRYKDDLNDETEKTGVLRECKFSSVQNARSNQDKCNAIIAEAQYAKVTYKVILCGASTSKSSSRSARQTEAQQHPLCLILAKAPPTHLKRILSFFEEKFAISTAQLKLPSSLLLSCLQNYVSRLSQAWLSMDGENSSFLSDAGSEASARRQAILKSVIGVLKLSISVSAASEVAPDLKTIELEVPAETVGVLFAKAGSSSSTFLDELRKHLHERTGLVLPLTAEDAERADGGEQRNGSGNGEAENGEDSISPLRVSKVFCAAFAVSIDGRLKFASRPIDTATNYEDTVHAANVEMLEAIINEARRRIQAG